MKLCYCLLWPEDRGCTPKCCTTVPAISRQAFVKIPAHKSSSFLFLPYVADEKCSGLELHKSFNLFFIQKVFLRLLTLLAELQGTRAGWSWAKWLCSNTVWFFPKNHTYFISPWLGLCCRWMWWRMPTTKVWNVTTRRRMEMMVSPQKMLAIISIFWHIRYVLFVLWQLPEELYMVRLHIVTDRVMHFRGKREVTMCLLMKTKVW